MAALPEESGLPEEPPVLVPTSPGAAPPLPPAGPTPTIRQAGLRGLLGGMALVNLLLGALWSAVGTTMIALQIRQFAPANYVTSLGLVLGIGAIGSMLSGPVMGTLSDRLRTRLGGRVPIMLAGAALTIVLAVLMGTATGVGALVAYWFVMQFVTVGFVLTSLSAHLPDRVPVGRRGVFSAASGVGALFGTAGGSVLGAAFASRLLAGYLVVSVALAVGIGVFALVAARSNIGEPKGPLDLPVLLRTFWVSPRRHPDFAWTFAARFLLYGGYFLVSNYTLYTLQDYVGLGTAAVRAVPLIGVAGLVGVVVSTPLAGWLVDRLRRTKPILFTVAATLAVGLLVPLFAPSVGGMVAYAAISGFGFGAYLSVDYVLITQVLPSSSDAAKDLGIINITATLPTTVAAGVTGLIITTLGGYPVLFPVAATAALLGGVLLIPIRSVR